MSELKSPRAQVSRYRVVEPEQATLLDLPGKPSEIIRALKEHAFVPIDHTADETGHGWVPLGCYRSLDFYGNTVCVGRYVAFSLRLDRRMIPAAAFKKALEDALDAELERTAKKFLSRDRKKELAEQTKLKILTRIPPTPTVVDLVWDTQGGTLLVTTHASAPLKIVEALFATTFGRKVKSFTPSDAVRADIDPQDECEFWRGLMTWLWNRQEKKGPNAFTDGVVQAQFSDRIELSSHNGTVRAVSEAHSWEEVRAGIKDGKTISAASLWLCSGEEEFDIVLKHDGSTTVKGPKVELHEDDTPESVLLERVFLMEKGLHALDTLALAYAVEEHGVSLKQLYPATRMTKAAQVLEAAQHIHDSLAEIGADRVELRVGNQEPVTLFEREKGQDEELARKAAERAAI